MSSTERVQKLLAVAGITLDGPKPWDIQVHDERLYNRVFSQGSLGLGESYMDGWWDAQALDQFFYKCLRAGLDKKIEFNLSTMLHYMKAWFINRQSKRRAFQVGEEHYDIGNDLYERMLDKRMVYTCGYWKHAKNLDEAQERKLDLVCRKLGLKGGMRVLDIGCGWGSFLAFAAERYGISGIGITVSKAQVALAQQNCTGLPVEIRLQDYRDVSEEFDAVVSLGMFEHVGHKNYRRYMQTVAGCLKEDGLFLLHTIGRNTSLTATDPWIDTYIFPNGMIPSIAQIGRALEEVFVMEDWHNFSTDYDKTLMQWLKNFEQAWPDLKGAYSERFGRMWRFYLCVAAAHFRARHDHLWQIVLSKKGVEGGYISIR